MAVGRLPESGAEQQLALFNAYGACPRA